MGKPRAKTQQANWRIEEGLLERVRDEAKTLRIYPARVVIRRLQHSYATSPRLPSEDASKRRK